LNHLTKQQRIQVEKARAIPSRSVAAHRLERGSFQIVTTPPATAEIVTTGRMHEPVAGPLVKLPANLRVIRPKCVLFALLRTIRHMVCPQVRVMLTCEIIGARPCETTGSSNPFWATSGQLSIPSAGKLALPTH